MSAKTLSIITVSYRCREAVGALYQSLAVAGFLKRADVEVILVDNRSEDGTVEEVRRRWPSVLVLPMESNGGFGFGCNAGSRIASAPILLFLNPDTQIEARAIESMLEWIQRHPHVAAVGPQLKHPSGSLQISCQRFPSVRLEALRQWAGLFGPIGLDERGDAHRVSRGPVDWVSGACMMVRAAAYEQVGPMDEGFFLYFEETDWCLRARRCGYDIHHLPDIHVEHGAGVSAMSSGESLVHRRVEKHYVNSRRRFFRKHHGRCSEVLVESIHWSRRMVARLRGRRSNP